MSELAGAGRLAPGASEAWRRHLGREIDADSLRAELAEGTLPQAFRNTALRAPARTAVTVDGETITYGDLDHQAARLAGWLRTCGIGPQQCVILCGSNSINFIVAYLGILRAGAIVVPAGIELTEHELRHFVDDSAVSCALSEGDALHRLRSISSGDSSLELLVDLRGEGGTGAPSLQQAITDGTPLQTGEASADEVAMLAYTSGTTGEPKGTPLSHANLLSSLRAAMWAWRWSEDEILLHALPFSHQHGLSGVQMTLLAGSRAVVHSKFDPNRFCSAVESEGATVIFAVPAIYEKLVRWEGTPDTDFSSLRLAVSGSAAMSPELARGVSSLLGQNVLERYGSTESGMSVSNPYHGERRFGSVGLPLPGLEMSIVDNGGRPLSTGEAGEIVLRGPQVFAGYWERPEATKESFYRGGWFRTGDIGCIDPDDGYLTITGRAKEMIISGGLNVYPREVEFALESHSAVDKAAVVGVPSERWGEEVIAFIVDAQGKSADDEELAAHARQRLSAYKVPKRFLKVEEFPHNEMGKVLRDELIQLAEERDEQA